MKKFFTKVIWVWLLLLYPIYPDAGPQNLQSLERLLVEFKENAGDILYPTVYQNLVSELAALREPGSDPSSAEGHAILNRLHHELSGWMEIARHAQKFFSDVLDARQRALSLNAENLSRGAFLQAEVQLQLAAEHFRRQKNSDAAAKAKALYQRAEREAIRDHLLGEVRILLHESTELGAEEFTPKLYQQTRTLLQEVESMVFGKRRQHLELSRKSRMLRADARKLLFMVQVISPLYQHKSNAETFLSGLLDQLKLLGNTLETPLDFDKGFTGLFTDIHAAVENLRQENHLLAERNARLEEDNLQLETHLLSYKSLSEQQQFLEQRVNRVKSLLKGRVEERTGFLAIRVDSVEFVGESSLPPEATRNLNRVLQVLRDFAQHPIIVRYLVDADTGVLRQQQLATARATAVRDYIHRQPLFSRTPVQALGLVYKSGSGEGLSTGQLEILVDLAAYLTFNAPEAKPSD